MSKLLRHIYSQDGMMSDDVVIRVENLWKRYGTTVGAELKRLLSFWRSSQDTPDDYSGLWALWDINFEVRRGETLGIIGRNGAGKSTLLKVLAGVTPATCGNVEIRGRVFPMIELNAGMHTDLTGRQNVYLLGAVMGFSPQEMQDRMPQIEEFCELEEWFDRPVRMYSSGMLARLGFGVAMNVDTDIMLIDEVLAVGDLAFRKKCLERMAKLYQSGDITILLVTHSPRQAERICDRGLMLQHGSLAIDDDMRKVAAMYYQEITEDEVAHRKTWGLDQAQIYLDTGEISFESIDILDASGNVSDSVETGQPMSIRVKYKLQEPMPTANFHFGFTTPDLLRLTVFNSIDQPNPLAMDTEGIVECSIKKLPLMPGIYGLSVSVGTIHDNRAFFKGENLVTFQAHDPSFEYIRHNMELVAIDTEWRFYKDSKVGGDKTL